ncbi:single-stranded DNA-binding protein [Gilliamella sp. wkB308]|uniref:single-stranded DNA-binding protein n=1 Tax=Gilliamella sp. wkB308 TaxID=3120263 RepID=UPI00080E34D0|nr:single-stranded DNA-binding protein [Gilliamella apicola]OCF98754.1 hypothetical protein A9G10_05890 [Gilliamella apicola]
MAINTLTATGHAGQDATLRYTQNGTAIGEFSLPVKSGYGDKQKTAWIKCVMWGKVAEGYAPYIKKGDLVAVSGEFYIEEWQAEGVTHSKPCLRVLQIQTSKKVNAEQDQQTPNTQPSPPPAMEFDDDIPF